MAFLIYLQQMAEAPALDYFITSTAYLPRQPEQVILPRRELPAKSFKGLRRHPSITAITLVSAGLEPSQLLQATIQRQLTGVFGFLKEDQPALPILAKEQQRLTMASIPRFHLNPGMYASSMQIMTAIWIC